MKNLIFLGAGILSIVSFLIIKFPHTLLSPGELTEGHQDLNNNCFACHTAFQGTPNNKCIFCHKLNEIGLKIDNAALALTDKTASFHEALQAQNCISCHSEHKGLDAQIKKASFDHQLISDSIVSNCLNCHNEQPNLFHASLSTSCIHCHNFENWTTVKKFDHAMILDGKANDCVSCHKKQTDELHLSVSASCQNCHNFENWKIIAQFDHNMINKGKEKNCVACHKKPNDALHPTVNNNCLTCHSMTAWKPATFDHAAYFVLDSDHNVACNTCHKNNIFNTYTCYGCHEHDPGNIASEHREEGIINFKDCVRCHKSADEDNIQTEGRLNRSKKVEQKEEED